MPRQSARMHPPAARMSRALRLNARAPAAASALLLAMTLLVASAAAAGGARALLRADGGEDNNLPAAHSAAPLHDLPVRRQLIKVNTTVGSYFHQPLVNCLLYTESNYTGIGRSCTLTREACASRCDGLPTCVGFKYAWFMNTQCPPSDAGPPPEGMSYTWCMPLDWVNISTCSAEMRWTANNTQFRPSDIWDMYWKYATPANPQAPTWTILFSEWQNATTPPPPPQAPPLPPAPPKAVDAPLVSGLTVGLGGAFLITLAALIVLLLRRSGGGGGAAAATDGAPARTWRPDPTRAHDVFLSYRRQDLAVADAVHDKLVMAGLRTFYDRSGDMAGRPFAAEMFRSIRGAPAFAPIVMLSDMAAWAAHDPTTVDFVMVEFIVALHYARRDATRLIYPLLVGARAERPAAAGGGERDYLLANPEFKTLRNKLPSIQPAATLAYVAAMFAEGSGEALDPVLAAATVRELIVGNPSEQSTTAAPAGAEVTELNVGLDARTAQLRGLLEHDACSLYGPDEQAGLVLRHRYAESMVGALYGKAVKDDDRFRLT